MSFLGVSAAIAGMIFCILSALGVETFCATSGCAITADFSFFGISLYWVGAIAFAGFVIVRVLGARKLALLYAMFFLLFDIGFLIAMSFMAPCLSCLIVACFIFLIAFFTWIEARRKSMPTATKAIGYVMVAWMFFLSPNVLSVLSELLGPSPVHGTAQSPIKIFFSPTCPACKEMVVEVVEANPDQVALYPVGKGEKDMRKICALKCNYEKSGDIQSALDVCWSGDCKGELSFVEQVKLNLKAWRNKNHIARMGKNSVPVMITQVMPEQSNKQENLDLDGFNSWSQPTQEKKKQEAFGCGFSSQSDDCDS